MNLGQSLPHSCPYLYHEVTCMTWTKPRLLWARAVQRGRKVEQLAGVKAWCHIFLTPSAGWIRCVCGQGLGQEEAWDTKEGEFHSPSSPRYTLPRLCFYFLAPKEKCSWPGQGARGPAGLALALFRGQRETSHDRDPGSAAAGTEGTPRKLSPKEPMSISPHQPRLASSLLL